MINPTGKLYVPKNADELRDNWLRDVRLEALAQGLDEPPIQPGTDLYIRATALANAHLVHYANLAISAGDNSIANATGEQLDDIRIAFGLPEVPASPSSGKVIVTIQGGGSVNIPDGTQAVLPNGLRIQKSGTELVADGAEVAVVAIDKGDATNLEAGKKVRWTNPPLNLATEAIVSTSSPLTGGYDAEDDARKAARIQNRLANPPQGGNWSQKIEVALNSHPGIQYAWVYPALGGPSSEKVVIARKFDPDFNIWTREMDAAATDIVKAAIQSAFPIGEKIVVQSVEDNPVDISLVVTIPDAASGNGWVDPVPWPLLNDGVSTFAVVSAPSGANIAVTTLSLTSPTIGMHIAWWSPNDMQFHQRLVVGVSGASPTWTLTLDAPMVDSTGAASSEGYISPAAHNMDVYAKAFLSAMETLGPGENTAEAARLPRSYRQPRSSVAWPSALSSRVLESIAAAAPEVSDIEWKYRSESAPPVPGAVTSAPFVLSAGHFGIYKKV